MERYSDEELLQKLVSTVAPSCQLDNITTQTALKIMKNQKHASKEILQQSANYLMQHSTQQDELKKVLRSIQSHRSTRRLESVVLLSILHQNPELLGDQQEQVQQDQSGFTVRTDSYIADKPLKDFNGFSSVQREDSKFTPMQEHVDVQASGTNNEFFENFISPNTSQPIQSRTGDASGQGWAGFPTTIKSTPIFQRKLVLEEDGEVQNEGVSMEVDEEEEEQQLQLQKKQQQKQKQQQQSQEQLQQQQQQQQTPVSASRTNIFQFNSHDNPMYGKSVQKTPLQQSPFLSTSTGSQQREQGAQQQQQQRSGVLYHPLSQEQNLELKYGKDKLQLPQWDVHRPYLTGDFVLYDALKKDEQQKGVRGIQHYKDADQDTREAIVLFEVLQALCGVTDLSTIQVHVELDGIPYKGGVNIQSLRFSVCPGVVDPASGELVNNVLAMCEWVVALQRFTERNLHYQCGNSKGSYTKQALANALHQHLRSWYIKVAQLEHQWNNGNLTIEALWHYIQTSMQLFQQFFVVIKQVTVNMLDSAQVLDLLQESVQMQAGRPVVLAAVKDLLNKTSLPYFRILQQWLLQGVLHDPYDEFMIEEADADKSGKSGQLNWSQRYKIRNRKDDQGQLLPAVPAFLQTHAKMILHTGKYLNVVRECSSQAPQSSIQSELGIQGGFAMEIQKAFGTASEALLDVLLNHHQFLKWLRQLKDFLLVGKSDWLTVFIDHANHLLAPKTNAASVSLIHLRNLLDLAVRSTSIGSSSHVLEVQLEGKSENEDGNNWEHIDLNIKVPWPLSIVLGQEQLKELRRTFSHIFVVKFVEWRLSHSLTWIKQCERVTKGKHEFVREAMALHHHMSYCVRQYLQFMTCEVIESAWTQMEEKLQQAQNLEQVLDSLESFVNRITGGCLIDQQLLRLHIHTLMKRCQDFCDNLQLLNIDTTTDFGQSEQPKRQDRTAYNFYTQQVSAAVVERIQRHNFIGDMENCRDRYFKNYEELVTELNKHYQILAHGEGSSAQRNVTREEIDHLHNFIQRVQEAPIWHKVIG